MNSAEHKWGAMTFRGKSDGQTVLQILEATLFVVNKFKANANYQERSVAQGGACRRIHLCGSLCDLCASVVSRLYNPQQ